MTTRLASYSRRCPLRPMGARGTLGLAKSLPGSVCKCLAVPTWGEQGASGAAEAMRVTVWSRRTVTCGDLIRPNGVNIAERFGCNGAGRDCLESTADATSALEQTDGADGCSQRTLASNGLVQRVTAFRKLL
jgi:hypothetical protein